MEILSIWAFKSMISIYNSGYRYGELTTGDQIPVIKPSNEMIQESNTFQTIQNVPHYRLNTTNKKLVS